MSTKVGDKKVMFWSKADDLKLVLDVLMFESKISKNTFDKLNSLITSTKDYFPTPDDFFTDLTDSMDAKDELLGNSTQMTYTLNKMVMYKGKQALLKLIKY